MSELTTTLSPEPSGSFAHVQRLLPRHTAIKNLCLQGYDGQTIARKLGITPRQVYNILNSPSFQHELSLTQLSITTDLSDQTIKTQETVNSILSSATREAAERLGQLISSEDEAIALRAAADLLDRTGYPKQTKTTDTHQTSLILDEKTALIISESLKMLSESEPEEVSNTDGEAEIGGLGGSAVGKLSSPSDLSTEQTDNLQKSDGHGFPVPKKTATELSELQTG